MNVAMAEPALTQSLRVRISDRILYLPVDRVQGVVERDRTPPPPLSVPFVSGLVVQDVEVLMCFRFVGAPAEGKQIKAVLVRGMNRAFLVEIDQMLGFSSIVASGPFSTCGFECPAGWIREGQTATGEEALWLDTEEALRFLTSATL